MFSYGFDLNEYKQKTALRRAANCIGAAYAFIFVFSFLINIVTIVIAFIMGDNGESLFKWIEDPIFGSLLQIVLSLFMFIPVFLAAVPLAGGKPSSVIAFKLPKTGNLFPVIAMGIGACQIGEILASVFDSVLSEAGLSPSMPEMTFGTSFSGVLLAFLSIAVVPALVEEFALRGVVLGLLKPYGQGFAIIVSSIIFGLMHGNLVQIPFAFIVGLALGFITVKTGSVWPAVLVHFINNSISVGFSYLQMAANEDIANLLFACLSIGLLLLGVIGTVTAQIKEKEFFILEKNEEPLTEIEKHKAFWFSPFIIIALVMTALEIIFVQVMY